MSPLQVDSVSYLCELVHVQLTNEAREFIVFKEPRKDFVGEAYLIRHDEAVMVGGVPHYAIIRDRIVQHRPQVLNEPGKVL